MFIIGIVYIILSYTQFKIAKIVKDKNEDGKKVILKVGYTFFIIGITNIILFIVRIFTKLEYFKTISIIILIMGLSYILYNQLKLFKKMEDEHNAEMVLKKLTK